MLLMRGADGDKLRCAEPFIEFISHLKCWSDVGLAAAENGRVVSTDAGQLPERLASMLLQVARDIADEKTGVDLSVDVDSLKLKLSSHLPQGSGSGRLDVISDSVLDMAVASHNDAVVKRENRLYSRDLWQLRFGSPELLVETILDAHEDQCISQRYFRKP